MNADNRKGELAELKGQLRQLAGSRAPGVEDLKRELYKKVISYLTVGIDVSSLFSEMVMCSATSDLVLKKMCYLYVGNYARGYPELALLTINFLQKDCQDDDPMIRGLALRSLCSLRVKNLVEYLVGPLQRGLKDSNGYVRSVAAIGVLKLYHIAPSSCTDNDFPVTLKALLLHDSDPQVVANCLCSLLEILSIEGNVSEAALREKESLLHRNVILSLLNRFKEFSEWAQCLVLEVVSKYVPEDAQETHDMMDVLDDRLQHANSAVVLATIKVFLHLTMSMADVHQKVYERIKAPLLTLVSSGSAEQSYAVLSHLHLLVMRAPMLFASDYKHFYCRYSDPSYVKKLKLEMLTAVANESNTYEIVTELSEYAANVDVAIARESIRAVGKIALQQYDVNAIVDRLLQFLEMEKDYVTAETLVLVKDLLRKYPQWSHDCIAVVGNVSSKSVTEPKAKAALVWMLGEYAYDMSDAPYVLEGFVQSWAEEDFAEVRLELLTAVAKCFFKRPPETVQILGAALSFGFADANQDVHDRALLYYRLLQHSVEVAERVINPPKQAVSVFAGDQSSEIKDRIFDEFNSLAVVYRQPSYMFLDKDQRSPFAFSEDTGSSIIGPQSPGREDLPSDIDARDNDLLLSAHEKEDSRAVSNGSHGYSSSKFHTLQEFTDSAFAPRSPSPTQPIRNARATPLPPAAVSSTAASPLLAVDDLLGLGPSASAEPFPPLKLNPKPVLDPASFKRKWGQLTVALTLEYTFPAQAMVGLTGPQPLVRHMQTNSVQCMASGNAPLKFFFFAQLADAPANTGFFLVELVVTTSSGLASAKIKADDSSLAPAFADSLQSALSKFGSL
ncbi:AP-4 complex subunit beta-1 [Marchantia polymorpha subsp. ruderalis]|uniref:Beta-adaptin-like protein n=2 Tax=Marchantia polymorpha TaxID=3197 RepID=A0AAF6BQ41_MARPO|nr:hypothetical protein MARPO_0060s0014 [Marchantia polymorpha]BBN14125.1 hypothetical protein Mp_6g09050 [Marchantia polymorpha subsp. ruderalis]|eukprot:PTQ36918.1 hypothetical protein MARPO_0060s0014 [Marchantia polymorpha]